MRRSARCSALLVCLPLVCLPLQTAWGQALSHTGWQTHASHVINATETEPALTEATGRAGASLPFPRALALAWRLDPNRTELSVNRRTAESRAKAAGSWFAGGPVVSGSYFDDHFIGSNEGYTTYQGEVSVPLWLPGQGSATRSVAQAEAEGAEKQASMAHMAVAVRLLDATAAALLAQKRVATTAAFHTAASRISTDVARAARLGEMTQADQQMADAARDTARTDYAMAQEEAQNAAAALEALLGSPEIPDIQTYTATESAALRLANTNAVEENDPRVQAARKENDAARAAMQLARRSFMPNPEVGIGGIHEKQYGSPWDDRVGVNFTMPLPSSVHSAPLLAAARNRLAAADRQTILARRMVRQEVAQARARLQATLAALQSARAAAQGLENRATLLERSWRLKETPLDETIRARQAAYTAAMARDRAEILWHAAIVRALIATGDLPGLSYTTGTLRHSASNAIPQQAAWSAQNAGAGESGLYAGATANPPMDDPPTQQRGGLRIPASIETPQPEDAAAP